MKTCAKCLQALALDAFYVRKNGAVNGRCKECVRDDVRAYRAANSERAKQSNRDSYQRHRDERLAQHDAWRAANPDKVKDLRGRRRAADTAGMREWRKNNIQKSREQSARWYAANKERVRQYQREWKARNPGRSAANLREWRRRNPEKHLAIVHARRAAKREQDWGDVTPAGVANLFASFGGSCAYCMTKPATTLDHYVPLKLGGLHALDNLLPACMSCNCSKGATHPDTWLQARKKV